MLVFAQVVSPLAFLNVSLAVGLLGYGIGFEACSSSAFASLSKWPACLLLMPRNLPLPTAPLPAASRSCILQIAHALVPKEGP